MVLHHRFLHRVQRVAVSQIFDGDQFSTIERRKQRNAGIDWLMHQLPIPQPRHNNGACTAITFRTAFFGAG